MASSNSQANELKVELKELAARRSRPGLASYFKTLSEDIWAVAIGLLIVFSVLIIAFSSPEFKFTTPVYQWDSSEALFSKVLGLPNLGLLLGIGVIFALLSSIAIALSGGSLRKFLSGFSVIYFAGITSLVIA